MCQSLPILFDGSHGLARKKNHNRGILFSQVMFDKCVY